MNRRKGVGKTLGVQGVHFSYEILFLLFEKDPEKYERPCRHSWG